MREVSFSSAATAGRNSSSNSQEGSDGDGSQPPTTKSSNQEHNNGSASWQTTLSRSIKEKDNNDNPNNADDDSEATELPSQSLQLGIASKMRNVHQQQPPHHPPEPYTVLKSGKNEKHAAPEQSISSPSSTTCLQGTPQFKEAIATTTSAAARCTKKEPHLGKMGLIQQRHNNENPVSRVLPLSPTTNSMECLTQDMDTLLGRDRGGDTDDNRKILPTQPRHPKQAFARKANAQRPKPTTQIASRNNVCPPPTQCRRLNAHSNPATAAPSATATATNSDPTSQASQCNDGFDSVFELPHGFSRDWRVVTIRIPISEEASIGVGLKRSTFPALVKSEQQRKWHCCVTRLLEQPPSTKKMPYCGTKYGIQVGDWFLTPGKDFSGLLAVPTLATFDEVLKWAKQRPYALICVVRKRSKADENKTSRLSATAELSPQAKSSFSSTGPIKKRKVPPQQTSATKKDPPAAKKPKVTPQKILGECNGLRDLQVPFCNRCNAEKKNKKRTPKLHHVWCPKNHCFDNSGADDIMVRIVQGRKFDCPACENEFQTGKPLPKQIKASNEGSSPTLQHNAACIQNQQRLDWEQADRERREEEQKESRQRQARQKRTQNSAKTRSKTSSTKNPKALPMKISTQSKQKKVKRGVSKRWLDSHVESPSSSEGDSSEDEMEDVSVYRPTQKRGRMQALSIHKRDESARTQRPSASKKASPPADQDSQKLFVDTSGHLSPQEAYFVSDFVGHEWFDLQDDPWGPDSHVIGDVVLFGAARGQGHFETFLPSGRYRIDPFESGSTYRKSHQTPEEGLSVLLLQRDTRGKVPWGFQVQRHDFGSACLVKSVDLSSPASGARWIGASASNNHANSSLNVYDMIIMINGKPVGGMTEVGFDLELELSSPDLYLVVARYKRTQIKDKWRVTSERNMLKAIDAAARDPCSLEWHEIGNGDRNDRATAGVGEYSAVAQAARKERDAGKETSGGRDVSDSANRRLESRDKQARKAPTTSELQSKKVATESPTTAQAVSESIIASGTKAASYLPAKNDDKPPEVDDLMRLKMTRKVQDYEGRTRSNNTHSPENDTVPGSEESDNDLDDDSNPWLGCVCGEIHSSKIRRGTNMFWIQCESCKAWYDVAETCIGFSEQQAAAKAWKCEGCDPCDSEDEDGNKGDSVPTVGNGRIEVVRHLAMECGQNDGKEQAAPNKSSNECKDGSTNTSATSSGTEIDKAAAALAIGHHQANDLELLKVAQSLVHMGTDESETQKMMDSTMQERRRISHYPSHQNTSAKSVEGSQSNEMRDESQNCSLLPIKEGSNVRMRDVAGKGNPLLPQPHRAISVPPPERISKRQASRKKDVQQEVTDPSNTPTAETHKFQVGDLVFMAQHSWPGVNHEEGFGHILSIGVDEDGDRIYDIKYITGRATAKGVLEDYLKPHSFD